MKISRLNRLSRVCALLITLFIFAIASCGKNGPKVDYVSETLEDGSELEDEFKLRAMMLVSDSDSVPTSARDSLLKEYFSCLENSAKK